MFNETICGISTAIGMGAIGIVRISGENAKEIIGKIFVDKKMNKKNEFKNRYLNYGYIVNDDKDIIDEVLVSVMNGPNTYTCEDIVEINCHGGSVSLRRILEIIVLKGARLAENGEFTKRAFLNGRLDLVQAEAVMDLISSKTDKSFDVAFNQLQGNISNEVKNLRDEVIDLMANIEVCIDYPEEDIEEITYKQIKGTISEIIDKLDVIIKNSSRGKLLRDGVKTVIVGKPNVGKSSLMNAFLRENRAIVTDVPGTTRDIIEEIFSIDGIPIKIIDTAGIRDTDDLVEKIGVSRSKELFNQADLIILVLNSSEKLSEEDMSILEKLDPKKSLILINKIDLPKKIDIDIVKKYVKSEAQIVMGSIINNDGLKNLESGIKDIIEKDNFSYESSDLLTNTRHITAIKSANVSLNDAYKSAENNMPYDFIEVDIKDAIDEMGKVNGESIEEDLLNNIFSNFCLGK